MKTEGRTMIDERNGRVYHELCDFTPEEKKAMREAVERVEKLTGLRVESGELTVES